MIIPIFPLNGAILFPQTNLPLNIFEERYISMVDYSLSNDRLIGMIQQQENKDLYKIGCFGKITAFNETPDKRYLISLEELVVLKFQRNKTKHKFRIFKVENIKNYNQNYLEEDLKKEILKDLKNITSLKN